jgi:hypothetical protein
MLTVLATQFNTSILRKHSTVYQVMYVSSFMIRYSLHEYHCEYSIQILQHMIHH